jgi:cation diffusion facilitator family transporter
MFQTHRGNSIEQIAQNIAEVRKVTLIGIVINIMLSGIKFVAGIIGSSRAVLADAVHSLSDMTTDMAILFGIHYWTAPADENHPYGHWRIETMVTAFIGILLAVVAIGIGYGALVNIRQEHLKQPRWIAFIGAFISIVVKEFLYQWTIAIGRKVKSSAVIANAWHHRSDALSSIPALLSVMIAIISPKWSFIDQFGAIVVSLFILHASWKIIKPALEELAETGVSADRREQIRTLAQTTKGVISVHAVRTRRIGGSIYIDLHIMVDGAMSVHQGHSISKVVKQRLLEKGPEIADVVVHLEPYQKR